MRTTLLLISALTMTLLAGCLRNTPAPADPPPEAREPLDPPQGDNSRTSVDWPGLYSGNVPTADGGGMETTLMLSEDNTYVLRTRTSETDGETQTHRGRFSWEPDGGGIKLLDIDSTDRPIYYKVGENYLRQLDLISRPIEGSLSELYYLQKDQTGLLETRWNLVSLKGTPVPASKNAPYLMLQANGQRMAGSGGCNSFSGTYLLDQDNLTFPPLMSTKMMCPDISTEQSFLEALRTTAGYSIGGDTLQLTDSRDAILATLLRIQDPE